MSPIQLNAGVQKSDWFLIDSNANSIYNNIQRNIYCFFAFEIMHCFKFKIAFQDSLIFIKIEKHRARNN